MPIRAEAAQNLEARMKRTSLTHPLQIAVVAAGREFGRVGITFCPGKYDRHAMSGYWDRDLALDLDTVRDWGAGPPNYCWLWLRISGSRSSATQFTKGRISIGSI